MLASVRGTMVASAERGSAAPAADAGDRERGDVARRHGEAQQSSARPRHRPRSSSGGTRGPDSRRHVASAAARESPAWRRAPRPATTTPDHRARHDERRTRHRVVHEQRPGHQPAERHDEQRELAREALDDHALDRPVPSTRPRPRPRARSARAASPATPARQHLVQEGGQVVLAHGTPDAQSLSETDRGQPPAQRRQHHLQLHERDAGDEPARVAAAHEREHRPDVDQLPQQPRSGRSAGPPAAWPGAPLKDGPRAAGPRACGRRRRRRWGARVVRRAAPPRREPRRRAFPMATGSAARRSIGRSLRLSPNATVRSIGTPASAAIRASAAPLVHARCRHLDERHAGRADLGRVAEQRADRPLQLAAHDRGGCARRA